MSEVSEGDPSGALRPRRRLHGADLTGQHLHGASYAGADLLGARLAGADLTGADLSDALLEDVDLRDCCLRHANLRGTVLEGAQLGGADLWGADCRGAQLAGAGLEGCELQDAIFCQANLARADLREARASKADFRHACLAAANLSGANLRRADCRAADLSGARLVGADLDGCQLHGAFLADVVLDRTRLTKGQLGDAIGEEVTGDYASAARGYLALERNFDQLGDVEAMRWAYLRRRRMEKRASLQAARTALKERSPLAALRAAIAAAADEISEVVCDYGESALRTMMSMLGVAIVFGAIYAATGAAVRTTGDYSATTRSPGDILVLTLSGMVANSPSGALHPAGPWVYGVLAVQTLVAVTLTGLLGFVIGNRIRR